jgi:hypothetical protein
MLAFWLAALCAKVMEVSLVRYPALKRGAILVPSPPGTLDLRRAAQHSAADRCCNLLCKYFLTGGAGCARVAGSRDAAIGVPGFAHECGREVVRLS